MVTENPSIFPLVRKIIFFLGMLCWLSSTKATTVYGLVTDEYKQPLPYANVYLKNTTQGATTNAEGVYALQLEPGSYEIIFSYVGFLQVTKQVQVGNKDLQLNVQLQPDRIELKEVVVTAGGEDPAYRVIREAIKKRKAYLEQIQSFRCKVYIKVVVRLDSTPRKFMGYNLEKKGIDSSTLGILYLSESESEYYFQQPGSVKEVMLSSRVSGDAKGFSWNKASDFDFNCYKNLVDAGLTSSRRFISPIAETALLYYRYKLLGTFYEDDQLVNKIAIIPKRKGDPVFSGFIYITESTWRIHSTDLRLQKDAQIDFIDSMQITQSYAKVNDTTYMPYSQNLNVSLNAFGFRMQAKFSGIYTNYEIDPDLPDRFFDAEVWKINSDANEKDSLYWQQHRKVPLTSEEKADYREKDSLEILQRSKPYLDSVDRAGNRMAFADLVFGYRNYQRYHQMSYHVTGILNFINYNTVEGFAPSISFTAEKRWDDNRRLRTGLTLRYGFANNEPSAKIRVAYLFDPVKTALWSVEGGRFVEQFNNYNPISPLVNTVYTLFAGENYMKLFMNGYVKGAIGKEVVNGVGLLATTSYNHRSVLENSTSKSFASESNLHFTSNDPQFAMCDSSVCFSDYNAWLFQLTATIKFGQKYISRPDEKIVIGSKYPALSIAWLRGLPWLNSAVDFDKLELSVNDHYKVGTFGEGDYRLTGGAFLNRHYVGAVELKHFNGNQTILASADHLEVYQLLPYYTYSTDQWYLQGHGEHHFQGLLFNHIPLVRKLQLREVVGVHYLQTTSLQYAELSVGIEHILKVIRIDYAFAFSNTGHFRSGILIGVNFNGNGITISNDD